MEPQLIKLPVASLVTEHNIRQEYGDLEALGGTFHDGQPDESPVVSPNGSGEDCYVVIHGNRRVEAARRQGTEYLYCLIRPVADFAELWLMQLTADVQHQSLSPLERAKAMRRLLQAKPNMSQVQLAETLGRSPTEICRTLALLDLCEEARQALREGTIAEGVAELLIPLDQETQARVLPDILRQRGKRTDKPTVAQARRVIAEATLTDEERQEQEAEALARSLSRIAEETRQKQVPDFFDSLLDMGEPAQAVHLLYYLMEAGYQVASARETYSLNGASPNLLARIRDAVTSLAEEAAKIQEVVK